MPKITQPKKTQKYSQGFKTKAVQLSLFSGVKVKDVTRTLIKDLMKDTGFLKLPFIGILVIMG